MVPGGLSNFLRKSESASQSELTDRTSLVSPREGRVQVPYMVTQHRWQKKPRSPIHTFPEHAEEPPALEDRAVVDELSLQDSADPNEQHIWESAAGSGSDSIST